MGQKQAKLKNDAIKELKNKTNFSEDEIRKLYQGFIEDCPSGKLTVEAFFHVYSDLFPNGQVDNFSHHVFRMFDLNNDGFVDFNDFATVLAQLTCQDLDAKLRLLFDAYDLDGDGLISQRDLTDIIMAIDQLFNADPVDNSTHMESVNASNQARSILHHLAVDPTTNNRMVSFDTFSSKVKRDPALSASILTPTNSPLDQTNRNDQQQHLEHYHSLDTRHLTKRYNNQLFFPSQTIKTDLVTPSTPNKMTSGLQRLRVISRGSSFDQSEDVSGIASLRDGNDDSDSSTTTVGPL